MTCSRGATQESLEPLGPRRREARRPRKDLGHQLGIATLTHSRIEPLVQTVADDATVVRPPE